MTKYFNIKTCPLCQKPLYLKYIDGHTTAYRCTTMAHGRMVTKLYNNLEDVVGREIEIANDKAHYEVLTSYEGTHQITTVPPYQITTLAGSGKTKLFKWPSNTTDFIMEIPIIIPDCGEDRLIQKLKTYILLS